jgi:hypothetical protein
MHYELIVFDALKYCETKMHPDWKPHLTPFQKAYRIENITVLPLKSGPGIG